MNRFVQPHSAIEVLEPGSGVLLDVEAARKPAREERAREEAEDEGPDDLTDALHLPSEEDSDASESDELEALEVISLPVIEDVTFPSLIGAQPDKPKKRKPVTYRGMKLARRPTPFEERVLSLSEIPNRFVQELDRTVLSLHAARLDQLRTYTLAGTFRERPLAEAMLGPLREAQIRMAQYGADQVREECARQGVVLTLSDRATVMLSSAQVGQLDLHGGVTAKRLHEGWLLDLEATRLRVLRAKRLRSELSDVAALADPKALWGLKGAVRSVLQHAFVVGRSAEMHVLRRVVHLQDPADLVDYVVQTAILDTNTCEPCWAADGTVFAFGSDEQAEYEPPFYKCLGGEACRCVSPDTLVWTAGFRQVPISDIQVGAEVLGWRQRRASEPWALGQKRRPPKSAEASPARDVLVRAKVIAVHRLEDAALRLRFRSGRSVTCTPDHQWLCAGKTEYAWREAASLRLGTRVHCLNVEDPGDCPSELRETDYVSGIEEVGRQPVMCLTTETGNFFANGLCSHNCLQIAVVGDWRDKEDVLDALESDRVAVTTQRQAERLIQDRQEGEE